MKLLKAEKRERLELKLRKRMASMADQRKKVLHRKQATKIHVRKKT